jgi:hypothetical protein
MVLMLSRCIVDTIVPGRFFAFVAAAEARRFGRFLTILFLALALLFGIGMHDIAHAGGAPPAPFSLVATPTSLNVYPGSYVTFTIGLNNNVGFSGNVALSNFDIFPSSQAVFAFSPATISGSQTSTITMTVPLGATPGLMAVQILGAVSGSSYSPTYATVNVTVLSDAPSTGFNLIPRQPVITVPRSTKAVMTVLVDGASNFSGPINLSVSGAPTGVASWCYGATTVADPTTHWAGGSYLWFVVAPTASIGTYTITLTGTAGSGASYSFTGTQTVILIIT